MKEIYLVTHTSDLIKSDSFSHAVSIIPNSVAGIVPMMRDPIFFSATRAIFANGPKTNAGLDWLCVLVFVSAAVYLPAFRFSCPVFTTQHKREKSQSPKKYCRERKEEKKNQNSEQTMRHTPGGVNHRVRRTGQDF